MDLRLIFHVDFLVNFRNRFSVSPEETYDILALIGSKGRYVIKRVFPAERVCENLVHWKVECSRLCLVHHETEYTTLPDIQKKLHSRMVDL